MNIITPKCSQTNTLFFYHSYIQAAATSHVKIAMVFFPDCTCLCVSIDKRNFVCKGSMLGMGAIHEFLTGLCCHRNHCCFLLNHPCSSFYQISMRLPQIDPTVCMFVHSPLLMRFVQPLISSPSVEMKFPLVYCRSAYLY
jgi:hypothetical protein